MLRICGEDELSHCMVGERSHERDDTDCSYHRGVSLPADLNDDVVLLRAFEVRDRDVLITGRDDEFRRYLGNGSPDPHPAAVVCVAGDVVGWIDFDRPRAWLRASEGNVGYNIFAAHRGYGYGTRALRLFAGWLERCDPPQRPTLLIDPANVASLSLAKTAGFIEVDRIDSQVLRKRPLFENADFRRPGSPDDADNSSAR